MKKVLNWTLGSFFRTLGRFAFYIAIGILLAYLLNGVSLPKINIFQLLDVSADTVELTYYTSNYTFETNTDNYGSNYFSYGTLFNVPVIENTQIYDPVNNIYGFQWGPQTNYVRFNLYMPDGYIGYYDIDGQMSVGGLTKYITNANIVSWNSPCTLNYVSSENTFINFSCKNVHLTDRFFQITFGVSSIPNTVGGSSNFHISRYITLTKTTESLIQEQIDNQNQNTQDIIDNQNANSQSQIDSQKVCIQVDKQNIVTDNKYLNSYGGFGNDNNYGVTDYINIFQSEVIVIKPLNVSYNAYYLCYYNVNKTLISCEIIENKSSLTIPDNAYYLRSSIYKTRNLPTLQICKNGNQATNDNINNINDSLNNSDSSQATNEASSFFDNFTTNTHGLTGIITAPLNAINSLTSQSCSPLVLPLPFLNQNLTLPCMRPIYEEHFANFMQIYDIITLGIISYWVMVRIFSLVKDFKNPEHDEVEVLDL